MPGPTFDLLVRTGASGRWAIMLDGAEVGSVDVHVEPNRARALVVVAQHVDDDALDAIITAFDQQVIPDDYRADVRFTVWRGDLLGTFAPEA